MTNQCVDSKFSTNSDVVASMDDCGIVLLHLVRGRLYRLNMVGARIWNAIKQHVPVNAIVGEISEEYRISHSTARENVDCFLAQLEDHRLIQREAKS
jgi:hypothetical protein